jgi:hypothetical protein
MTTTGTAVIPDRGFPDEETALLYARDLIQRGYRMRIVGPRVTMESEEVLRRVNSPSILSKIAKSPVGAAIVFLAALSVPAQAIASSFKEDADAEAHHLKVSFQPTPVSGTGGLSTSITAVSGAPVTVTTSMYTTADQVVLDGHLDTEYRLLPYKMATEQQKPPPQVIVLTGSSSE